MFKSFQLAANYKELNYGLRSQYGLKLCIQNTSAAAVHTNQNIQYQ